MGDSTPLKLAEETNREIAGFEEQFRKFFRGEDRSNLQAALFNVPGRLVAGCWADYENMAAVFLELLAHISPEEIGRRMKKPASRPGIFQITCLLVSYLIAREQRILLCAAEGATYRDDDERAEEMHLLFDAGRKILTTARNDGRRFPGENHDRMPLLDEPAQQELIAQLCAPSPHQVAARRHAWAALTAYNFLFHGEMRDGIFNHGPYEAGDRCCLLVKELTELHNDFFPWAAGLHPLPSGFVRAVVLRDTGFHFDVLGGLATQPSGVDERIVADGIFELSAQQLVPCDESRLEEVLGVVTENTAALYEEFVTWDDGRKLRYGTLLHANFLRGFWEMVPGDSRSRLAQRMVEAYQRSGERHFQELIMRKIPLVMEHMAKSGGPVFSRFIIRRPQNEPPENK